MGFFPTRARVWVAVFLGGLLNEARATPTVGNLVVSQRPGTKWVDLTYDLDGGGYGLVKIVLEISGDGGETFDVPASSATGAVGDGIAPGGGKQIVWDAGEDWGGNVAQEMRFRLVADAGFAEIPGGGFTMGRTSGDGDTDAPPVAVTVSTFFLQKTETTKAQWDSVRAWALARGYSDLPTGAGKGPDHPVHSVTWSDAVKWCNARSEKEGLTPCYTFGGAVLRTGAAVPEVDWSANGYRLPTEAEWEKAARGGIEGKRFPWGTDAISHGEANFQNSGGEGYQSGTEGYHPSFADGVAPYTGPVGSFGPNARGLVDMSGNVLEWCWDWYDEGYYAASAGSIDPRGPGSGSARVCRGGAWSTLASDGRVARRLANSPMGRDDDLGFRVARGRLVDGFAAIPGGTFAMGRTSGDDDTDAPPILVAVGAFSLQETETTKAEWDEVRSWAVANGYTDLAAGAGKAAGHPVHMVNWFDAVKWCNARSEKEALTPCYAVGGETMRTGTAQPTVDWTANGYRLPTEAEWEKAARGGIEGKRFPWGGDTIAHAAANYSSNASIGYDGSPTRGHHPLHAIGDFPYTAPTGSFAPNGYGLRDMVGNVAEWCWDWYSGNHYGISHGTADPKGAVSGVYRVQRGGDWDGYADYSRASARWFSQPGTRRDTAGFRAARALSSSGTADGIGSTLSGDVAVDTRELASLALGGLSQVYDGHPQSVSATTDPPGLAVAFTYDGSPDAPVGAGSYAVVARIVDATYQGLATGTLVVAKAEQRISFPAIPDQVATASVSLSAAGGASGSPVTFSVAGGSAQIEGTTLTFAGAGPVSVVASQAGDDNHEPAPEVARTFHVAKAAATVNLTGLLQTWDGTPKSVGAETIPAGLPVSFTYDDSSAPPTNPGSYAVVATVASQLYEGGASRAFVIAPAPQSLVFATPGDRFVGETVSLAAVGGASGKPVSFAVLEGPAKIQGGTLVFTGAGPVRIVATQGGDDYHEATSVERSFQVVLPRPDVAVAASRGGFRGVGVYAAPSGQRVTLVSRKARPVRGRVLVANRAIVLPGRRAAERLAVRGPRGNRHFRVAYAGPGGNLTAAIVGGTYRTAPIDAGDAPVALRVVVKPNRKRLKGTGEGRTVAPKRRYAALIRAGSTVFPLATDGGVIQVRNR